MTSEAPPPPGKAETPDVPTPIATSPEGGDAENETAQNISPKQAGQTRKARRTPKNAKAKPKVVADNPVPLNWARKAHLADRMPVSDLADAHFDESVSRLILSDASSYGPEDFVYVEPTIRPPPEIVDDVDYGPPPAFRIGRVVTLEKGNGDISDTRATINWLLRPVDVLHRSSDSRELVLSTKTDTVRVADFRGSCTVQNKVEMRNMTRYREKVSHFWYSRFYCTSTSKLLDVVPVSSLKALSTVRLEELSKSTTLVILEPEHTKQLCEAPRRRKTAARLSDVDASADSDDETTQAKETTSGWPFNYFNPDEDKIYSPIDIPLTIKLGESHQAEVADWHGQPVKYYIPSQRNEVTKSQKVKLVESGKDDILNGKKPWLQQMPVGYIARGGEATSIAVSLPLPSLEQFIKKCQDSLAPTLEIEPASVNFLDACCTAYCSNAGDESSALVAVSRLPRNQLTTPKLSDTEHKTLCEKLNPFMRQSWHQIYKSVGTKPVAELTEYFWVNQSLKGLVSGAQELWKGFDGADSTKKYVCSVCKGTVAPKFLSTPGYVPLSSTAPGDTINALCVRCARLWYRYQVPWQPNQVVRKLEDEDGVVLEPELIEDAKAFTAEVERRQKRRDAAQRKLDGKNEKAGLAVPPVATTDTSPISSATTKVKGKPGPKRKQAEHSQGEPKSKVSKTSSKAKEQSESRKADGVKPSQDSKKRSSQSVPLEDPSQLLQYDATIQEMDADMEPENVSMPNYCSVCCQLDQSMAQKTCALCGLNVHIACYGPGTWKGEGPWLCDCCNNGRDSHALDYFYQCKLCPPSHPTYAQWLNGTKADVPDALKGTTDKSWCHVRCAVWTESKFTNPGKFEGIDLTDVDLPDMGPPCSVCSEHEAAQKRSQDDAEAIAKDLPPTFYPLAGKRIKCWICDNHFHVSCAAKEGFSFGFTKEAAMQPVIVCNHHGDAYSSQLVPMSYLDLKLHLTTMQLYVSTYRTSKRKGFMSGIDRRRISQSRDLAHISHALPKWHKIVLPLDSDAGDVLIPPRCSVCGDTAHSYWRMHDSRLLCPLCSRGMRWPSELDASWFKGLFLDLANSSL